MIDEEEEKEEEEEEEDGDEHTLGDGDNLLLEDEPMSAANLEYHNMFNLGYIFFLKY